MAIRIHYGVHTFETAETDATELRGELWRAMAQSNGGLWRVKTSSGTIDMLVTRDIPIAVVEHEKPASAGRKMTVL